MFTDDTPSVQPSAAPSTSLVPSSSPLSCAYTISTNVHEVNFLLDVPSYSRVAVVQDSMSAVTHTMFYSLEDDEWKIKNAFQEGLDSFNIMLHCRARQLLWGFHILETLVR